MTTGPLVGVTRRPGGVQSLDCAFELLELMAAAGGEVALSKLAAASGLPVPTIHRLVRTLVDSGHVLQLPSRRYALGPRLIGLGVSASQTVEAWASPHLLALAETSGETANLAMLDVARVVYVARAPSSRHTMRMFTEVSGPASRVTRDSIDSIVPVLVLAADGLSGRGTAAPSDAAHEGTG